MGALEPENRTLVRHAIDDIQGSIRANDQKSSAGLIVQGLLATAVVTLVTHFGGLYREAAEPARVVIQVALIAALVLAVLSIGCMIAALAPYEPKRLVAANGGPQRRRVFFPDVEKLTMAARHQQTTELSVLGDAFDALDEAPGNRNPGLDEEYVLELLSVAQIRRVEATWAKRGFWLLLAEVSAAAIFLATAGCVAASLLGARADLHESLSWQATQGGARFHEPADAVLQLPRRGPLRVQLLAEGGRGLAVLRVSASAVYRCPHGGHARAVPGPSTREIRLGGAERAAIELALALAPRRCGRHGPARVGAQLHATARTVEGEGHQGTLVLQTP